MQSPKPLRAARSSQGVVIKLTSSLTFAPLTAETQIKEDEQREKKRTENFKIKFQDKGMNRWR